MRISGFILVIDSYLVRKGLLAILNRMQGVRVLKEFDAGDPFIAYLNNHAVDYIIISQSEFDRSVDHFISRPELLEKTVLVRDTHEEGAAPELPRHDVHGIIHLHEKKESIIRIIENLINLRGQTDSEGPNMKLSPRETTIVRMVSLGLTNRQIAEKLFLSAHTVMTHRKNISSKLGIKSVSGLTIYAIVNNIITIEEVSS
jgi:DNA-binding NarL/FixJ family response regulator